MIMLKVLGPETLLHRLRTTHRHQLSYHHAGLFIGHFSGSRVRILWANSLFYKSKVN